MSISAVAIIPARGGSKRIPRKNIKNFHGYPMISYPIKVLQESGLFERIVVSTDDQEIGDIALQYGAEVPFIRPAELADDFVGTTAVVLHAVEWLIEHDQRPDYVCCAYPTSPFLASRFLHEGWDLVRSGKRVAVATASFPYPIQRSFKLLDNGGVAPFFPEYIPYRSQDLEPAYHDAGQFYWWDTAALFEGISGFSEDAAPVILPRYLVQDIDDEEDWQRAELMYRVVKESGALL